MSPGRDGNGGGKSSSSPAEAKAQKNGLERRRRWGKAFRKGINEYVYRRGNGSAPQAWPLIRRVVVRYVARDGSRWSEESYIYIYRGLGRREQQRAAKSSKEQEREGK